MTVPLLLGADIGGTKLAAGVVTPDGTILSYRRTPTPHGPDAALDALAGLCRGALSDARAATSDVAALGIGCGGPLDRAAGVVISPVNLPGWRDVAVVERLGGILGLPAAVDNDATAAAVAEAWWGAGAGLRSLLYLTISTGIGGGIVLDGRPYRGAGGNAGEFGHASVAYDGPACRCGNRGCLENVASGTAIGRRAREALATGRTSSMVVLAGSIDDVTAETVVAAVRGGDALAREIWDETVEALASGIAAQIAGFDPDIVVLGGGVTAAGEVLLEPLRLRVRARTERVVARAVPVVISGHGPRLGVLGAAAVAAEASGHMPRRPSEMSG